MIAGFAGLLFNPSAWIAIAAAAFIGFSGGFIKGYSVGDAGRVRLQISYDLATAQLEKAAADRNATITSESQAEEEALAVRALAAEQKLADAEKTISELVNQEISSCSVPVEAIRAINSAR